VGFEADYGYSGRHLQEDGEWTGQVGLFAEWSLWDGGSDDARLAQAREREHQAALAATEIARTTLLDRHDAIRTLDRTREGLRLATVQAALADSQIVLARDRFREGGSGNLEVVQAQAERNAAHAAWIDAAGAHQAALVRLRWATGRWDGI
jgi:outer membrane protein TolC